MCQFIPIFYAGLSSLIPRGIGLRTPTGLAVSARGKTYLDANGTLERRLTVVQLDRLNSCHV